MIEMESSSTSGDTTKHLDFTQIPQSTFQFLQSAHTATNQFLHSATATLLSHCRTANSSSTTSSAHPDPFSRWTGRTRLYPSFLMSSPLGDMSASITEDKLKELQPQSGSKGPILLGHVYAMVDEHGVGLAIDPEVESAIRMPEWIKKMFTVFGKNEKKNPVCKFFMDVGDAVVYANRCNIAMGHVGTATLDSAYTCTKEEPHLYKFVPNAKQVSEANKLLKGNRCKHGTTKIDGVPVFSAQNLCIAVAIDDGIKWYTPYFFEKKLLDNILEASVDQHFHSMIQNRCHKRRQDVLDDSPGSDSFDNNMESLFEPHEVQEVIDEMGHPSIPLSVITKVAEIELLDVVDRVLLGNKWLRKTLGVQPKFPYLVDSFEARSAASILKAKTSHSIDSEVAEGMLKENEYAQGIKKHHNHHNDLNFPFGNWFSNPWSKEPYGEQKGPNSPIESTRSSVMDNECANKFSSSDFLPIITMICIINSQSTKKSRLGMKKRMMKLSRELEDSNEKELIINQERDPLFVANVGDYSTITRTRMP